MELQSKITVKGCGWDKNKILAYLLATAATPEVKGADGKVTQQAQPATYHETRDLVKVVGVVNRVKPGQTIVGDKTNDYLRLIGNFTGVNLSTGEIFSAPQCILSDTASAPIADALSQEGVSEVQFAVLIGARYAETAATGYQFYIKPLLEVKPSDKMAALLALAGVGPAVEKLENKPSDDGKGEEAPPAAAAPAPAASSKSKGK